MKKLKYFLLILLSIIFIISSFLLYKALNREDNVDNNIKAPIIKPEPEKEKIYKASFIATGDALIHQPIYSDALKQDGSYDFKPALEYIKPIIQKYDIAFYNQETILGGKELGYSTYPRFNTPNEFGDAMIDAGFNVVALANNHTLDKGMNGVLNSVKYWKNTSLLWNGMNENNEEKNHFSIHEKNGITYTLLSYTTLDNGLKAPKGHEYLINLYDKDQVEKDIKSMRDKVDLVIVSMHWGVEYSRSISTEQMNIATHLSECGVDIIIGTHPHVLQPISRINNTVVMWSLGNFISSQRGNDKLTGALASLDITKTVKNNHTIIELSNIEAELIYTYKTTRLRDYKVIPFNMMESKYLINYDKVYEEAKIILTKLDDSIIIKPMN